MFREGGREGGGGSYLIVSERVRGRGAGGGGVLICCLPSLLDH